MKQVNLLPKLEQKELKLQFFYTRLRKFWITVVISLVVYLALAMGTRFYLNNLLSQTQAEVDKDKIVLSSSDFKDLQTQIMDLNKNIREIKNLDAQHYYFSRALIELANLIPPDMQLNQVVLERSSGQIEIAGQAKTRDSVIALWSSIIKSEYFKNINFPLANLERAEIADFTFKFFVNKDKFKTE